jgi:ketosteroid isomerase-like protein
MLLLPRAAALLPLLLPPPRAAPRCEERDLEPVESTPLARAQTLETMLSLAVATEQYEEAARLRDELASLGLEQELAVLQANDRFYRCFSGSDLQAMDELWATQGLVTCTHPGHPPLSDREAIMTSWAQIFRDGSKMEVRATDVQCSVAGKLAFCACLEKIEPGNAKMACVNIFARQDDGSWSMVVHHAGPVLV